MRVVKANRTMSAKQLRHEAFGELVHVSSQTIRNYLREAGYRNT